VTELRRQRLVLLPILLFILALAACTPSGGPRLDPGAEVEAERQHAAILDAYRHGDVERARALSVEFLEARPDFREAALLRRRLAESYLEEARWDLALHHLGRVLEDYPRSDERWPAITLKARALAETGRRLDSATGLDRALDYWPENSWRERARALLVEILDRGLSAAELKRFLERRPRSGQLTLARLALAERMLREGRGDEAKPLLESVVADSRSAALQQRARRAMQRLGLGIGDLMTESDPAAVREGLVGVLAPMAGRFSVYGEAFLDGARLALARFNSENLSRYELVAADTGGEPVTAALAARSLILEEGVGALMGGVLSNPTVAAAVEANARQVPLLSPSATVENIHEIGPWVFQNNITGEAQVLAVARLAVRELLGARFGVLYPKQGNGQTLASVFEETIFELGGEIVVSIPYEVGMTDFAEPLDEIRRAQPEILFLPGEVEQLLLLVPQLAYHDIGAQLLGNEAWNSRRLARLGGRRVNGAIFPSDVLLKRDRELYSDFLRLYERRYASSVNPVAARGFLGMTMMLEIMGDGARGREALREQLSLRTADTGDPLTRRELLSEQVTLMTVRDGEILPYGNADFFAPEEGNRSQPFIDGPWSP
jgi:branched-chain amino acid transport system substrate-binding protein